MAQPLAISSSQVRKAAVELERMKRSLAAWLKYRKINDAVIAGQARTKIPPGLAKKLVLQHRDLSIEQDLATRLHTLLAELDVGQLPDPNVRSNPGAAVELASIALAGGNPTMGVGGLLASPASTPWLWPVLIVGGLLLLVTTAIKTAADVAKERERYACIQAGACTDYGFWLKAGGVAAVGWFAWKELGLGDAIRSLLRKRRS